ncbi:MAG: DHHA1 domain-containing protein [Campylobacterota bacterium]|nr:DHHA1 domain-containing protein [Campylobacterota bacterium]
MKRVYHLSHIDLDGYGCQYLTTRCFDTIECYNANYGPEVKARLEEIVKKTEQDKFLHGNNDEALILITDLNLTTKEAGWIEKEAMRIGAKLQLLDHHGTGAQAAERFAWYKLDTTRCATLITYDWLQQHYSFDQNNELATIVQAINAIDIWISDDELFEFGKVCLGMISGAREVNRILFPAEDRALKLSLIEKARTLVTEDEGNILLDDALHPAKKAFFIEDKNDTKDNLVANYVTNLLSQDKTRLTINYRGYKGLLGYNVGNSSLIGNAFLISNPDYDFYMDVNFRGHFSLRSNDKLNVSKMAAEIGNGGGHPNASGGKIENYKDSFVYSNVKTFVQNYIDGKTENNA